MKEFQCPNCNSIIQVSGKVTQLICERCRDKTGQTFIMTETTNSQSYINRGDGLFEKRNLN